MDNQKLHELQPRFVLLGDFSHPPLFFQMRKLSILRCNLHIRSLSHSWFLLWCGVKKKERRHAALFYFSGRQRSESITLLEQRGKRCREEIARPGSSKQWIVVVLPPTDSMVADVVGENFWNNTQNGDLHALLGCRWASWRHHQGHCRLRMPGGIERRQHLVVIERHLMAGGPGGIAEQAFGRPPSLPPWMRPC